MRETDRLLGLVGLRCTTENKQNNNILFNFMNSAHFNFIISAKEVMFSSVSVSCLVGFSATKYSILFV